MLDVCWRMPNEALLAEFKRCLGREPRKFIAAWRTRLPVYIEVDIFWTGMSSQIGTVIGNLVWDYWFCEWFLDNLSSHSWVQKFGNFIRYFEAGPLFIPVTIYDYAFVFSMHFFNSPVGLCTGFYFAQSPRRTNGVAEWGWRTGTSAGKRVRECSVQAF